MNLAKIYEWDDGRWLARALDDQTHRELMEYFFGDRASPDAWDHTLALFLVDAKGDVDDMVLGDFNDRRTGAPYLSVLQLNREKHWIGAAMDLWLGRDPSGWAVRTFYEGGTSEWSLPAPRNADEAWFLENVLFGRRVLPVDLTPYRLLGLWPLLADNVSFVAWYAANDGAVTEVL